MTKPDFFIIGAPKCGTTSLIYYLAERNDVCISVPKEPHFFSTDLPNYRQIRDLSSYESSFNYDASIHLRTGEASTWYLFSREAVKNILEYNTDARIIIMIRNPVEMVESLYQQFSYGLEETASSVEEAWGLQDSRLRGENIPTGFKEPSRLQYRKVCELSTQLERTICQVERDKLKIILFDDFKNNTKKIYDEVVEFLALPADKKEDFLIYNTRKDNRSEKLAAFLKNNGFLSIFAARIKKIFNTESIGLSRRILKFNERSVSSRRKNEEFHLYLVEHFKDEISKIEILLKVDLEHWRK
ncbi:MAG: sulfotransferase domain-containing protein [Pseudomonadales bacterium]